MKPGGSEHQRSENQGLLLLADLMFLPQTQQESSPLLPGGKILVPKSL